MNTHARKEQESTSKASQSNPPHFDARSTVVQPKGYPARTGYPTGPVQLKPDADKQTSEEDVREPQSAVIQLRGYGAHRLSNGPCSATARIRNAER